MWEPQGYYSKFMLKQPTILFGKDAIQGLHNLPCAKCAVIYGKGFKTCHQQHHSTDSFQAFQAER